MAKDTIIYMAAKGVEGIVGIVTMSVMTMLFIPEQMGHYSIVNIAVTTIGMVCIQWLVQSVMRYTNKYQLAGREDDFYTTVFMAWLRANLTGIIFTAVALPLLLGSVFLFIKFFGSHFDLSVAAFQSEVSAVLTLKLLAFCAMWFIAYNTSQLAIAMLAALREAKLNLLLSVLTVCGKLGFMYLFCKMWGSRIEWIFLSYFITDGAVALIGLLKLRFVKYINAQNNSAEILTELKKYGMPLMGNMITTSVLNKSDIYIIAFLLSSGMAGIYQTNYSLIAVAFTMLSTSVMRGSYPTILRMWSEGKKELTEKLVSEAVRVYLLLSVPAVLGVAAVSDVMAKALFAPQYYEGHSVMFWVALGMMFLGLTEYSIKHWELNADTKAIFRRSLIGGIVNVALNLIFVKLFNSYYVAAVTTFIGFFVYFILARTGTMKYMKWHVSPLSYIRIIGSAAVMFFLIVAAKYRLMDVLANDPPVIFGRAGIDPAKMSLVLLVFGGMIVYGLMLLLSGEVDDEVKAIFNRLKNGHE